MNSKDLAQEYIDHYIKYVQGGAKTSDSSRPELDNLVYEDLGLAFEVVTLAIELSDDKEFLSYLAAGPLEDILSKEVSTNSADILINNARKHESWRHALRCIWTSGIKNSDVKDKVSEAIELYGGNL